MSHPVTSDITKATTQQPAMQLIVTSRKEVAERVLELTLQLPTGGALDRWTPGAHIDLCLESGLVRQYSLCGDTQDESSWRIAVLREDAGRGGSKHVHDHLVEGSTVSILGLRNHFEWRGGADTIFIAGGIGITPILPMIAAAEQSGQSWELHYGGRNRQSMAYLDLLQSTYPGKVTIYDQSESGPIDLEAVIGLPRNTTQVYCCGPNGLLNAVQERCAWWPAGSVVVERFTADRADRSETAPVADTAFDVTFAQSGITARVEPGRSIIEVAKEHGIAVITSCEEGICGTCETPVLAGEIDHRDSVLSDQEKASGCTMLICVSRCRSSLLVLDL